MARKVFLLIVDAYTSWPIVRECRKGGTALELRDQLIEAFTNWGIPEILVTDGGPQFTAHTTQEFTNNGEYTTESRQPIIHMRTFGQKQE